MIPGSIVMHTADHSPNGVKIATQEGPTAGAANFEIGIIENVERRSESGDKWDQTTQIPDNAELLVHWIKKGDVLKPNMTNPAATRAIGKQATVGANGTIKKPDAEAAFDIKCHLFVHVHQAAVTGDTIAIVKYVGFGPIDAS
jgi:hypothetical protein